MDNGLTILNMTNFFNRELFLYSLGDLKLRKPVSLKKAAYVVAFLVIWTLPFMLLTGFRFDITLVIAVAPPFLIAHWATKPVFGGRGLLDAITTTAKYIGEPGCWTDFAENNLHRERRHHIQKEIWISRRRELQKLADEHRRRALAKAGINEDLEKVAR